jgi:hypothetical protein
VVTATPLLVALALGAGCATLRSSGAAPPAGDEVALYRDRAVVIRRLELTAAGPGAARLALRLPAGVEPGDAVILDRGGLEVAALRAAGAVAEAPAPPASAAPVPPSAPAEPADPADDPIEDPIEDPVDAPGEEPSAAAAAAPIDVELEVIAPRAGRFAVTLGYTTEGLAWEAAYTMTTTPARDRAVVRGALAIRNTTGVPLRARTRVIDADLGAWRERTAVQLRAALRAEPPPAQGAEPRELGVVSLGDGETRVELLPAAPPRALRSVLVYDPVGAGLDHTGAVPVADPALGAAPTPARVSESFEIARDPRASRGLPAGPVRLLERHADGSLELLGEARLFGAATRVADFDTIAIGTAQGVIARRERRDWAKDDGLRRFSEEFLITIDNARPRPVELVLREHLYRGQNWTLAYQSAPAGKEGAQQIALRTTVPANGRAKVLYVVVYTW